MWSARIDPSESSRFGMNNNLPVVLLHSFTPQVNALNECSKLALDWVDRYLINQLGTLLTSTVPFSVLVKKNMTNRTKKRTSKLHLYLFIYCLFQLKDSKTNCFHFSFTLNWEQTHCGNADQRGHSIEISSTKLRHIFVNKFNIYEKESS